MIFAFLLFCFNDFDQSLFRNGENGVFFSMVHSASVLLEGKDNTPTCYCDFESSRLPEQRRIGFRVGVREDGDGDEEEKFTTLFEGLELFLARFSVCLSLQAWFLASCFFGLSTRANSFFRLVLRCAMNKDIPA